MNKDLIASQIRMSKELYEKLRSTSFATRIPINTIMVKAIEEYMNANSIQVSIKA